MKFNISQFLNVLIIFFLPQFVLAQVAINTSGATPDASAMLDISSTTKGLLIPKMTTAQRNLISSPATSLMVFDITTNSFWFFNGSSWKELLASKDASFLVDADGDTKVQTEESPDEDLIRFDMAGSEAMVLKVNSNGDPRLEFTDNNIFVGQKAGLVHATGINNIYYGENSGLNITTGNNNTLFGFNAGASLTSSTDNVIMGYNAGSMQTSGDKNVFVGHGAGSRSGGSNNVMIGYLAGNGSSSGSNNVFIGPNAGKLELGSNKLVFNYGGQEILTGDFLTDTLTFHKNATINGNLALNGNWLSSDGDDEGIYIDNNGNIGIQTNTPSHLLSVKGNFKISSKNFDVKFETNKYITKSGVDSRFISIRVNGGNGTKSNHFTTSNWVSVSKPSTGVYVLAFNAGTFAQTPIITGIAQDNNRLVIVSASNTTATVEIRDLNGNLINANFMVNIIGER